MRTAEEILKSHPFQTSVEEIIKEAQTEAYNQAIADARIELTAEEQAVMDSIKWPISNLHKHVYFHLTEEGQVLFNTATIKLLNATFKK